MKKLFLVILAAASVLNARADNVATYWDANGTDAGSGSSANGGGSGSWDSSTSDWWVSGNADTTWTANNIAYFAGTAGTVTLNANETVNGLVFSTAGYTITNTDGVSTLTLATNNPTISVPAGTTTISCNFIGGGLSEGLTASGPGTLFMTGSNTYTGGTLITNGTTLKASRISDVNPSAIGNSGNLTLGGGTLLLTGPFTGVTARNVSSSAGTTNTIDVAAGTSLILSGSVTGTSTSLINKTDTGTLTLSGNTDNAGLNMNINAGTVIIQKNSTATVHGLGGGPSSVGNGGVLQLSGTGAFGLYSGCALTVNSGGVFDLNSQSDTMSTLTLSGTGAGSGALINSSTVATSTLTAGGSGIVLAAPATIGGPGNITLPGLISGNGPLTHSGASILTISNTNTYSNGTIIVSGATVMLTNSVNAAGTGLITNSGTLGVGISGNNATLTNAISGAGIINIYETTNQNLQLGGSMSGFTGTINCPASATTAKCQILTTNVALSSSATLNLAAGGTFYTANPGVIIPCPVNIHGAGNSEVYGALRIESGALISGPVTLFGSTTMGNSKSGAGSLATISGNIAQSGGTFGITFTAVPGTVVLTGTNTYGGTTAISGGVLQIGGAGKLGNGSYAGGIVNNATFNYASSAAQTLSGIISGTGALNQNGPGKLTLSAANTYSGATTLSAGATLALTSSGLISSSSSISLAAGATFDVSAYALSYALGSSTTLKAGGTGIGLGSTAAAIKGGSSATINVGPLVLTFTPQNFTGDATHPALYISQGALSLGTNSITISNAAATPLGAGTYSLIQVAGGNISASGTNFTVTGAGLASSTAASLSVSSGSLNLVVVSTAAPRPAINHAAISNGSLILSGTNGPASSPYYVLTSTNATAPLSLWTSIATNNFSPAGTFSFTNAVGPGSRFFAIKVP